MSGSLLDDAKNPPRSLYDRVAEVLWEHGLTRASEDALVHLSAIPVSCLEWRVFIRCTLEDGQGWACFSPAERAQAQSNLRRAQKVLEDAGIRVVPVGETGLLSFAGILGLYIPAKQE